MTGPPRRSPFSPPPPLSHFLKTPPHEGMQLIWEPKTASGYERVYEASWETVVPGRHSFFISAVTRSSLFDDEAPFSAQLWGVPYITQ